MSSPEVLDLSLAGYAALVARSGVDPDAEVRRFDGTDPGTVYDASGGFGNAARGMEQAWASSWDSQAALADSYTVDGAPVRDRATHEATLPAGFREASEQLDVTSTRVGAVATSLGWESAQARSRLRTLHGDVTERAAAWARDVAAAGLIPPDQKQEWLDARTRVEQQIITMITDAHGVIVGSVGRYEDVIATALAGLADAGFTEAGPAAPAAAPAPAGEPPVLAGLGTPIHAGLAADPVTTALGNFVETETDLAFTGPAAGLTLARTHNSRDPGAPGPFGPRWASWASTRLTADDTAALFRGPDGRQLTVLRRADGSFGRVPDLTARILPGPDDGLLLAWNDGRRWIFGSNGRPRSTEHGPGTEVTFTHDELDRLVRLTHAGGASVELTWAGTWITHATGSDGRTVAYRYDDDGHLVHVETLTGDRRYGIDGDGRVATVTDADGVVELVNTYDDRGRVIRQVAPHGRVVTFAYDATVTTVGEGGRVAVGERTHTHDAAGQLVTTTGAGGDRTCTHDGTGRRTTDGDRTYRWDPFGRLHTITDPDRTTQLHHDALGDLAAADDLSLTWDALHPAGALLAAGDHTVVGLDTPWALTGPDGTHRPLLPDWQGSTGTPGPDPWGGAAPTPGLGYRGELALHDLVWLRHRAYDPATRSFLSPDPLPALPGTAYAANPYHYAGDDPVDNIDPWGLRPMTDEDLAAQGDGGGFSWSALGHGILDVVGIVPVVGEVADLANAAWYAAEGDWVNATLALAAAVPFLGWAAVGGKWGIRGVQAVRSMDGARTWLTGRPPMVPRDAVQRPFTPDENFAMGERYVWNRPNAAGNDQNVRYHAHGPDPRRPETENAGAGPIYRIQQGNGYFDAQNVRHPVNAFNPNSPAYNPSAANDTHIPYPADLPRPDRANVPVFVPNVAAIGDPTTEETSR